MCGWAGAGNIGDELLTRALLARLESAGAEPVVVSRDPTATTLAHGVEAVPWGFAGRGKLRDIDGVCLGPGGILQDSSSVWSLPGHLVLPQRAKRMGAVVRSLGVGAEPLGRRSSGWMLRQVLGDSPIVTRDEASSSALAGASLKTRTGADLVFGLALPSVERRQEIVVAVGPAVGDGRFSPAARRLESLDTAAIASAVDALADRYQCTVALAAYRGARDRQAAHEIRALLHSPAEVLDDNVDLHVARTVGARLIVSSRYHPIVLAAISGTPAIVVSAQAKVRSLCEMIGAPLVTQTASWAEVAEVDGLSIGAPIVPTSLDETITAVEELVTHARAARRKAPGG
ncbi:MAG: polysaccharide pyruvyl transferase CsaB [Candidatus Aldehydirespiratoraceae bacterium]